MIDLRTDTVTRPTEAMLVAMREASFGDDSRDGDPTVMKLETMAAERMGKEAGAFMPSGTMTNLVAVLTHTQRGGEIVLESESHVLNSELGGIAALAGTFYRGLPGRRGAMGLDQLREALRLPTRQNFAPALVCMETTHNRAGGAVLPIEHMRAVRELAASRGVPVHLDGARIFNAATALGLPPREIACHADSVTFCVSKGLSAPVGSVLCGTREFIERARAFRRMVGGNLRQAGPLAAAGIVALETMVSRLAEDHATAQQLAAGLAAIDAALVDPAAVETNIVRVDLAGTRRRAADWSSDLREKGILVAPADAGALRFVTHRHIAPAEIDAAIAAFSEVWKRHRRAA